MIVACDILVEYIEIFTHALLHNRNIYPQSTFITQQYLGIPVFVSSIFRFRWTELAKTWIFWVILRIKSDERLKNPDFLQTVFDILDL